MPFAMTHKNGFNIKSSYFVEAIENLKQLQILSLQCKIIEKKLYIELSIDLKNI